MPKDNNLRQPNKNYYGENCWQCEDLIKANKTQEEIKEEWLQFVDTLPKYVNQAPKDVIADWWLQKLADREKDALVQRSNKGEKERE